MKRIYLLLLSFILSLGSLWAQEKTITGTITGDDGSTLPGVSIVIEGTTQGTVTNLDGKFSINVPDNNAVLVISYLGYLEEKVTVGSQSTIEMMLLPDIESIQEVVVVGFGTQKRERVSGAISDASGNEIRKLALPNLSQAMQEVLPGVYGEIQSGQPGEDDAKLTVRGTSTFVEDGNDPLILIDGIESSAGFSQIDASEVSSVTVLKDASATAIYGNKGANGVIIITTKRGAEGPPRFSASYNVTLKQSTDIPPMLGAYDAHSLNQIANRNSGTFGSAPTERTIRQYKDPNRDPYLYPDVNWYDELMQRFGKEHNARVNLSGGTKKVKYFSSLSYLNQGDIFKTDVKEDFYDPSFNYNRFNYRSNFDIDLTSSTKLSTDIGGRTEKINKPNSPLGDDKHDNMFKRLNTANSYYFPAYYPEEFVQRYPDPLDPNASGIRIPTKQFDYPSQNNPYYMLNYKGMVVDRKDVLDLGVSLNQKLNFITEGLVVSGKVTYSTYSKYVKKYTYDKERYLFNAETKQWSRNDRSSYNDQPDGFKPTSGEDYKETKRNLYYEAKINYDRSFGNHNVSLLGVFNRTQKDKEEEIDGEIGAFFPARHEAWGGRMVYDYRMKYIAEFNVGYNGSDNFAKGKRFGIYPAGSVAWIISRENFMANRMSWLSYLKVRFSAGKTGSERPEDRYLYRGGWKQLPNKVSTQPNFGVPVGAYNERWIETKIPNADATWEESFKQNLGIELKVLNNDLSFVLDVYKEHRTNIFIDPVQSSIFRPGLGNVNTQKENNKVDGSWTKYPPVNEGETKTTGLEAVVTYNHLFGNGISIFLRGNINTVDTRIIKKSDALYAEEYKKDAGKPLGWKKNYYTTGYLNSFEEAVNAPSVSDGNMPGSYQWSDFNADGKVNDEDKIPMEHTSNPLATYGFSIGGGYKSFELRVSFFGKHGVYYETYTDTWYALSDATSMVGKDPHMDTWAPDNQNAEYPAWLATANSPRYFQHHNRNFVNASYLRLQNASLSYLLTSKWLKEKMHVELVKFSISGSNLYSWNHLPWGEPEGGNGVGNGVGNYPLVRRIMFGLDLNF